MEEKDAALPEDCNAGGGYEVCSYRKNMSFVTVATVPFSLTISRTDMELCTLATSCGWASFGWVPVATTQLTNTIQPRSTKFC